MKFTSKRGIEMARKLYEAEEIIEYIGGSKRIPKS